MTGNFIVNALRSKVAMIVAMVAFSFPTSHASASPFHFAAKGVNLEFYGGSWIPSLSTLTSLGQNESIFLRSIGANSVCLVIPFYTPSATASNVYFGHSATSHGGSSPTPAQVAAVIKGLAATHLKITLKPLLNQSSLGTSWRGIIKPTNVSRWFHSYVTAFAPYLRMDQSLRISGFVLQAEMVSLSARPQWRPLAVWASSLYKGNLIWDSSANVRVQPAPLTTMGVWLDTYPDVFATNPTIPQIIDGWNQALGAYRLPLPMSNDVIGEVGILAQDGSYPHPWKYEQSSTYNQTVQAKWFQAACAYGVQHRYRGIYFWSTAFGSAVPSLVDPNPSSPMLIQPSGYAAIRACFAAH